MSRFLFCVWGRLVSIFGDDFRCQDFCVAFWGRLVSVFGDDFRVLSQLVIIFLPHTLFCLTVVNIFL